MSNGTSIQSVEMLNDLDKNESDRITSVELIENSEESQNNNTKKVLPKPVFRSYKPQSSDLKDNILPDADSLDAEIDETVKIDSVKILKSQIDRLDLQPRKIDWDLKRNIDDRLKYLHRKTRNAIVELVRKRYQSNNNYSSDD